MIRGSGSKAAGAVKISARRAERAANFSAARQISRQSANNPLIRHNVFFGTPFAPSRLKLCRGAIAASTTHIAEGEV
jgi:hypothetical protein